MIYYLYLNFYKEIKISVLNMLSLLSGCKCKKSVPLIHWYLWFISRSNKNNFNWFLHQFLFGCGGVWALHHDICKVLWVLLANGP